MPLFDLRCFTITHFDLCRCGAFATKRLAIVHALRLRQTLVGACLHLCFISSVFSMRHYFRTLLSSRHCGAAGARFVAGQFTRVHTDLLDARLNALDILCIATSRLHRPPSACRCTRACHHTMSSTAPLCYHTLTSASRRSPGTPRTLSTRSMSVHKHM